MRWVWLFAVGCGGTVTTPTEDLEPCGGFAGLPCAEGRTCLDDASDDCDPAMGGADCIGLCYDCVALALGRDYLSRDLGCDALDWTCGAGQGVQFDPACGCWCE